MNEISKLINDILMNDHQLNIMCAYQDEDLAYNESMLVILISTFLAWMMTFNLLPV